MENVLRFLLCGLVVAAPWLLGAQTPRPQMLLAWPVVGLATLQWLVSLFRTSSARSTHLPTLLIPLLGLIAIGGIQLLPWGNQSIWHSVNSTGLRELEIVADELKEVSSLPRGVHTFLPDITRLCVAQISVCILAFWLAYQLFESPRSRTLLFGILTLNAVALTGFAIAQQLTWNGKLYWTFPLRYGGSPFGPYTSRNNGAAYLLIGFSCAVATWIGALFPMGLGVRNEYSRTFGKWWRTWWNRLIGNLTPSVIMSLTAVIFIAIGIMASLSRAGQMCLVICLLVLFPAISRWSTNLLVLVVIISSIAYGGLIWLGRNDAVTDRISSMSNPLQAMQGRFDHWSQVEGLLHDFPHLGCGWGCYRWVNPLYLSKDPGVWFYHAENQYLEVMAEAGLAGLICFVGVIVLAVFASARAIRTDVDGNLLPAGICGLLAATAIATNSVTNFALSMGSISLTCAILLGAIVSAFTRSHGVSPWIHWESHRTGPRLLHFVLGAMLVMIGGWSAIRISSVGAAEADIESIPLEEVMPQTEMQQIDELLAKLDPWSKKNPSNWSIWAAIGELRIYRMRRALYDDAIHRPEAQTFGSRGVWENTHLERLDALVTYSRSIGDSDTEQRLLSQPGIAENARVALTALDRAAELQPLDRQTTLDRAWLKHLLNTDGQEAARDLALLSNVSQTDSLFQLGQLSQRMEQREEQIRCWRRSLNVSSKWASRIWNEMTLTEPESEVLQVFPDQLESLQIIMPLPFDKEVRRQIIERCHAIISNSPDTPLEQLARLHAEEGKLEVASEEYLRAIQNSPRNIELRLEASIVIERSGQIEKARSIVATAHGLAPQDASVKRRLEELLAREREKP